MSDQVSALPTASVDIQDLLRESKDILKEKTSTSDRIRDYKIQLRKAKY